MFVTNILQLLVWDEESFLLYHHITRQLAATFLCSDIIACENAIVFVLDERHSANMYIVPHEHHFFCIESEHVGQPFSSFNLVIAGSEFTSIVKGVVRMKVTGECDVKSGWWSSGLLLGRFKSGCTFRLEEYVLVQISIRAAR